MQKNVYVLRSNAPTKLWLLWHMLLPMKHEHSVYNLPSKAPTTAWLLRTGTITETYKNLFTACVAGPTKSVAAVAYGTIGGA